MHPLHPYLARQLAEQHARDLRRRAADFRLARAAMTAQPSRPRPLRRLLPTRRATQPVIDLATPTAARAPAPPCLISAEHPGACR